MTKSILVGYDPATADAAPAQFGVAAARFTGASLIIALVCASAATRERISDGELDEDLASDATSAIGSLRAELEGADVRADYRQLEGPSAARVLHEAAEAMNVGLLVVGSTRRGPFGRVLPGSTAQRLMEGAPCPIAVVPHGWQPEGGLETVGAAYVDTDEGREALRQAHALARSAGARLRVITVAPVRFGLYAETEASRPARRGRTSDEVEGEHRLRAEAAASAALAGLDDHVEAEVDAFLDDPAETLIGVSANLDLLVCGSRGYGPLRAVLLGGVSRRVAAEAQCPVIVLPRGVERSLEALVADAAAA
jgi:nucleotide-binding universal stress UspA family protein